MNLLNGIGMTRPSPGPGSGPTERPDGADIEPVTGHLPHRVEPSDGHAPFSSWKPPLRIRVLLLVNVCVATFYVMWWLTPGHVGIPVLFYLLAAAEGFSLVHQLGLWWAIWATKVDPPPVASREYSIDVFIPTKGEPLDILMRTIGAAVAMDLPHRTLVLDDADREEVALLAQRLGAEYLARPRDQRGAAKAGNLNYALSRTTGELFAIFDADHVPRQDFLRQLIGYFEDERLAFVQTPQFYGNSRDNPVARGAFQQQAMFYGPICRGKNGLESAFCCGTNVLFRRAAIEDVGGFDRKSVVEDFVTSMRIHRRGWTSVYFPYVLAEGLGPTSLRYYFRQQFRWARGSVGALLSLEPFKRGFRLGQRVQYLLATTFYLIGLVTAMYVALPALYMVFGWSAFSSSSASFVFFYAPYLLCALLTIRWGLGGQLHAEHLQYTFGTFPVYAVASIAAILHIPARFRVTGKKESADRVPPALAWVTIVAFVMTAAASVYGVVTREPGPKTFTNLSWAVINLFLLWGIVWVAVREMFGRRPRERNEEVPAATAKGTVLLPIAGGQDVLEDRQEVLAPEAPLVLPEHAVRPLGTVRERWSRHRMRNYLAALTVVGFVLRVALINTQSLRLDESLSLNQVTTHSLIHLWKYLVEANVHVPLYHTILYLWVRLFGGAEWVIRIPSVLLGTACIPLLFLVARRVVGERSAMFAAAIGAASPFWIWHSDEARMYPLLLFMVLSSMYLMFRALDRDGFWPWAAFTVVTGLSLYAHYFALLMPPVQLAYLLINRVPRRKLLAWLASMVVVGLMFLPWVLALYYLRIHPSGLQSLSNGFRGPPQTYTPAGVAFGLVFFVVVFLIGYGQAVGHGAVGILAAMVAGSWPLIGLLAVTTRRRPHPGRSRPALFLTLWLVLTVGVAYTLNVFKPGLFLQRYLIAASPALFMLIGMGLARFVRPKPIALGLVVVALGVLTVGENVQAGNPVREDFRGAASIIEQGFHPGDLVIVMPEFYDTPLRYYLKGRYPLVPLEGSTTPIPVLIRRSLPAIAAQHQGDSLWVITPYESQFDPGGTVRSYLSRTLRLVERHRLGGDMELRRYVVPVTDQAS